MNEVVNGGMRMVMEITSEGDRKNFPPSLDVNAHGDRKKLTLNTFLVLFLPH